MLKIKISINNIRYQINKNNLIKNIKTYLLKTSIYKKKLSKK